MLTPHYRLAYIPTGSYSGDNGQRVINDQRDTIMYKNYCSNRQIPAAHKLKKTPFFKLTSKLTHADPKLRKAVDYVTVFLINDNFKNVENILFHFGKSGTEKKD
jgi:hypothetical protein